MLITLFNWIYIFTTLYVTGHFFYKRLWLLIYSINRKRNRTSSELLDVSKNIHISMPDSLLTGFAVLTAASGYYSLIAGVGIIANVILIVSCIAFVYFDLDDYYSDLQMLKEVKLTASVVIEAIIALTIIVICLYYTAYGRFDYDTGLYHAQSIHWIEEYGVVPGLAYMQTRLGFNSSFFCISALYSLHNFGNSLHSLNGFLMASIMLQGIHTLFHNIFCERSFVGNEHKEPALFKNKKSLDLLFSRLFSFSNIINLLPFFYFTMVCYQLSSPTTDCASNCLIIWVILSFVRIISDNNSDLYRTTFSLSYLSVMAVFLVSIKLSVGVIALIVILPAIYLVKNKKWSDIIIFIFTGIVLIAPYFIRNVIITGWLIYPFPALDLFNVDWKIPLEGVQYESDEIIVWARYTKDVSLIDQSMREWLPIWWREQGEVNRYISTGAFIGTIISCVLMVIVMFINKLRTALKEKVFLMAVSLVCFAFWMVSAPSNRFGYAYLFLVTLMGLGLLTDIVRLIDFRKTILRFIITMPLLAIALVPTAFGLRIQLSDDYHSGIETLNSDYLICQRDYERGLIACKSWNNITMFFPLIEGTQIWYDAFPAILYESNLDGIEMRDGTIKKGFRLK